MSIGRTAPIAEAEAAAKLDVAQQKKEEDPNRLRRGQTSFDGHFWLVRGSGNLAYAIYRGVWEPSGAVLSLFQ